MSARLDIDRAGLELAPLEEQAHGWVRLLVSGEATQADAEALKHWCDLSPGHAAAFAEASRYWRAFGEAGQQLRDERARRPVRTFLGRRAVLGGALAASAAVAMVRPPLGLWPSLSELRADYRTGAGEQRDVRTNDGVAIQLNSRTSLSIEGEGPGAFIELIAGEASFAMAPHAELFSVVAAGGRSSAVSGRFELRILPTGACVTCLADRVNVAYQGRSVTLGPRQRVTYGPGGFEEPVSIDPEVASAWQNGLIVFRMTPLAEAIEELNRYRQGRIVLLNDKVAQAPLNGRFRINQPEEALLQIEKAFGIRRRTLPAGFVLLS